MKRILCAVLTACILFTSAACRPKEDPFKGYTTQGDISGGVPLDHQHGSQAGRSCYRYAKEGEYDGK